MQTVKIYLAGAMGNLSIQEQTEWRNEISEYINTYITEFKKEPIIFSPPNYYTRYNATYNSEREAMIFDLDKVRKSDLIIANFENHSIGTIIEVAVAYENKIPILGLNRQFGKEIHPWLTESCIRVFDNLTMLISYVINFYLK